MHKKWEYNTVWFSCQPEHALKQVNRDNPEWDIISIISELKDTLVVYRVEVKVERRTRPDKKDHQIVNLEELIKLAIPIIEKNSIISTEEGSTYADALSWIETAKRYIK